MHMFLFEGESALSCCKTNLSPNFLLIFLRKMSNKTLCFVLPSTLGSSSVRLSFRYGCWPSRSGLRKKRGKEETGEPPFFFLLLLFGVAPFLLLRCLQTKRRERPPQLRRRSLEKGKKKEKQHSIIGGNNFLSRGFCLFVGRPKWENEVSALPSEI